MKYKLSDILVDIAAGPFGSNLKASCFVEKGFPIIDGANLNGFKVEDNITKFVTEEKARSLYRSIAKRGDVVVTISGNVGQISYIPEDSKYEEYLCSQRQFRVTFDKNRALAPWLVYFFHTRLGQHLILQFASQVGVPALSQPLKNFRNIQIDLPDLETQQKVVRILSALDEKIELNNKNISTIKAIAHTIYQKIISEQTNNNTIKLGELCAIKYGKNLPTSKILGSGYRVYGGNGVIGFFDKKMYDEPQVLISCRGAASGKVVITRPECFVTNNSLILECPKVYHHFIKEFSLDREYYDYTTGSAQPQITIDNIKNIELPILATNALNNLNELLNPLEDNSLILEDENDILSAIRDTLLSKLMSGEINLDKVR